MRVDFLNVAKTELDQAIDYYNQQSEGLGFELALEVKNTIERIVQFPKAWTKLSKRSRRCRTNRFPYAIIYQIRSDRILVTAVMHMHRNPKSWKSRL